MKLTARGRFLVAALVAGLVLAFIPMLSSAVTVSAQESTTTTSDVIPAPPLTPEGELGQEAEETPEQAPAPEETTPEPAPEPAPEEGEGKGDGGGGGDKQDCPDKERK